jgi:succinoglycan biosynthesis transport protein ExoP
MRVGVRRVMQAGVQPDRSPGIVPAGDIDLGALRRALWRKKFLILGLTLLTAAIAFAGVNYVTPRYKSEARVLLEMRENIFLRPDAEKTAERTTTVDQEAVTSQVQLILSRDLAREVIKKLNLAQRPEFDPVLDAPSPIRTVLGLVGIIKDPADMTPEERVFKSYYDRLSAFQVEKSRVIAIEFESQDPELAALVANTIVEVYIRFQQAAKQEQTRAASAWLAGEIERLRASVAQAEARVEQYRAKTNLFIGNNNTTLSNQQLGDFNAQLAAARAQKADAESKAKLIREALKSGTAAEFSDIINSELMRRLSEQRVTLRAQLAEQSSTLLDQHPRIKELRAQIADLERQLRAEADRLARSLENDARVASSKVDELSSMLDQLKRQAASTNEQDVQLRALERDAKSQRDLLESYLAKYREASARDSIGAAAPDARIISAATVSNTPSWPKKVPIILVAALAMFTLSSAFVVTGELLRTLPMQGSAAIPTPVAARSPVRSEPAQASDVISPARTAAALRTPPGPRKEGGEIEGIEALARELIDAGEGARRVTVIGALRNVGTTRTAIALARSLAGRSRVVLVELAAASRNLSAIANDPSVPGLAELVEGSASFGDIITRDRHSRAHLIMAGRAAIEPVALVNSQRLSIAIEALGRSYDHVIIDAGVVERELLDRFAMFAPRAVLVAPDTDGPVTVETRERLLQSGFADVNVIVTAPSDPGVAGAGAKAAA